MAERPIIFSGPMVRAMLAGQKTQTRRIVKPQPSTSHYLQPMWGTSPDGVDFGDKWLWREVGPDYPDGNADDRRSPYGQPGDRLWVREGWRLEFSRRRETYFVRYAGNGRAMRDLENLTGEASDQLCELCEREDWTDKAVDGCSVGRWRPSIHMFRWASRLTLEVTGVRVERLQEISEEDAKAEGTYNDHSTGDVQGFIATCGNVYRRNFALLWDSINGKRAPWKSNPWVWVIEFKWLEATP